jgi:hypothetical protein
VVRRRKSPGSPSNSGTKRLAVTFEQVRLAAHVFPGVEDSTSYGTPALKVRGKLLARLHQSGECLVLRADLLDREISRPSMLVRCRTLLSARGGWWLPRRL